MLKEKILAIIKTARPKQWIKNFSLFAAPLFGASLLTEGVFLATTKGFLIFCLASSAVYFFNDALDVEKDKRHPVKRLRPIAAGKLSPALAKLIASILATVALLSAYAQINTHFTYAILAYLLIQAVYTLVLRGTIILDALAVASGFIIRVFAGGLVSATSISSWLILTTIGLSMLLAFGKRRSEKTILKKFSLSNLVKNLNTRATLENYPDTLLDSMISISAAFCLVSYSLFTFQTSHRIIAETEILPSILKGPRWMMLTIPIVIYGVARYLYVIYEKNEGESPDRVLIKDLPLLITVILWILTASSIIYLLPLVIAAY